MKKLITKVNLAILVLGIVSFASVIFVQMPIQSIIANNPVLKIRLQSWALVLILTMVAGFVQELFKVFPALLAENKIQGGIISGFAFGVTEALFLLIPAIQQNGIATISPVAYFERLSATIFHMATTGLIMYGLKKKKFILWYVGISIIHGIVDMFAGLYSTGIFRNLAIVEAIAGTTALVLAFTLIYLVKRDGSKELIAQT